MPLMRLQKFLSAAGVCSRRKGEEFHPRWQGEGQRPGRR